MAVPSIQPVIPPCRLRQEVFYSIHSLFCPPQSWCNYVCCLPRCLGKQYFSLFHCCCLKLLFWQAIEQLAVPPPLSVSQAKHVSRYIPKLTAMSHAWARAIFALFYHFSLSHSIPLLFARRLSSNGHGDIFHLHCAISQGLLARSATDKQLS